MDFDFDEEFEVDSPDGASASSSKTTPKSKRRRRGELNSQEKTEDAKAREKKFCDKWLGEDMFKGWVAPVEEKYVRCIPCGRNLAAGRSELMRHADTEEHQKNAKGLKGVRNIAEALQQPPRHRRAEEELKEAVKKSEIKISSFYAEHNIAILTADHLVELCKKCFPDSKIAQNMSLDRTKCTAIIQNVLGATEKEDLANDLRNCKFSVLVDESTYKGNTKNMCAVVVYVCPRTGSLVTQLLELIELDPTDCSAANIFGKFRETLEGYNIPLTNIVGLACDNAPVMVGVNNSFFSRLKEICPWLILLNCICHSAAIAASHACKKLPAKVEALIRRVANYVSGSPKRSAILEEFQEYYHQAQLKMINPSRTRWLVLHPCVVRLLDNKVPLQEFFTLMAREDKKDAEAAELLDLLRNPIIHANLLFLKYTLQYFNKMNALFQTEDIMIHKLKEVSLTYLKQLCQNYMRPNVLPSVVTIDVTYPHFQVPLEQVYLGPGVEEALKDIPLPKDPGKSEIQLVQMRDNEIKTFRLRCLDFYVTAAKEMKTYLPLSNKIVDEAKYIEPEVALSVEARTDLPDLRNSLSNFKVPLDLDIDAAVVEWREMPYTLENEAARLRVLKPAEFWFEVGKMRDFSDKPVFPELSKLAKVTLALPHSNASAERTFSVVTDTKTNKRNKMKNKTLDSICVVRSAMKRKKETCFDLQVRKEHLDKHNKTMYNV